MDLPLSVKKYAYERMKMNRVVDILWRKAVPFPPMVAIEVTNRCNLDCPMCPRPIMQREVGIMEPDLYRKIVDEVAPHRGVAFLPQGFGETFMHPQWKEMISYAREKGISPVVLITNGAFLNEKNTEALLDLQPDELYLSIDGVDPEIYAKVRLNGDLERVERNTQALLDLKREKGLSRPLIKIRIIRMKETEHQIEDFRKRWEPHLMQDDEVLVSEFNSWAQTVDDRAVEPRKLPKRTPCKMLWRNMSVYWDGRVTPCCFDVDGVLKIGNANEESLTEIWNGEELRRLREAHLEGHYDDIPLCRDCLEWPTQ